MEQEAVIEVCPEQTGGGWETLDEAAEVTWEIRVVWASSLSTWVTVLPGMVMRDIKNTFCRQV